MCIRDRQDPVHDKPTSYMHNAFRHSDYMEELTRKAWGELGKPYYFTEPQVEKIMQHALGEGQHQEVLDLHNRMHPLSRLDSVGALLEPYRQHLESGGGAYDLFGDMPPIQHLQLPPEMQPKNLAHFHQMQEELRGFLRNRNYTNADIQQKLDELFIDLSLIHI